MIVWSSLLSSKIKDTNLWERDVTVRSSLKLAGGMEGENLTSMLYCSYLFTSCGGSTPRLAAARTEMNKSTAVRLGDF